jgi:hypothetical protein
MMVFGYLKEFNDYKATVWVESHQANYECYVIQPISGENKIVFPFSEGDQVAILIQENGENAIMGGIYSNQNPFPNEVKGHTIYLNSKEATVLRAKNFDIANDDNISLLSILEDLIAEVMKIVVLQGVSPNKGALLNIKTKLKKLLI